MNIEGLEDITLIELKKLYSIDKKPMKEALPILREFRDKYLLTDRQAVNASRISKKIFD